MSVRFAVPDDEDRLFALVFNADEEMPVGEKDANCVRKIIHAALHDQVSEGIFPPRFGVIGGANLEGAVGLYADRPWHSHQFIMTAFFLFVHPDFRKSGHLSALRRFSEGFARDVGLRLSMRVTGDDTKVRMLGRNAKTVGAWLVFPEAA